MTTQQRPLKGAWGITALLFLFMLINFADKVVLNIVGPSMTDELGLSPRQFGLVGSSFFFLFALSAILVGFKANSTPTRTMLLIMAIVWSVVQFPMVGTVSLEVIIACRIALGAGEGPASPIATHAVYKWFPDHRRGLPTAIIAQGSAIGVVVAIPLLTLIMKNYSWHWAFGALGIAGLLWVVLWLVFGREGTLVDAPVSERGTTSERIPYRFLLTCPTILAICCGGFSIYWGLALGLTWFSTYLVRGLGFSKEAGANLSALPWLVGAVVLLVGGYLSQQLKSKGVSSRLCRGLLACSTIVVGGCALPFVGYMPTPELKIALLVFGSAIGSTFYVVIPMIVSELTPLPQRAAMLAIVNSVVTTAGALSPYVMGSMVQDAANPVAGYERGYILLGGLMIAGGLIGAVFIRPEADRKRLAMRAAALPDLAPARA